MTIRRLVALPLLVLCGCSGGEDVNTRTLSQARGVWDGAGVRDYDLEWTTSGDREGHYLVFVRDGAVRRVHAFVEDRRAAVVREIEVKRADLSYYGVEGLFKILAEEQATAESDPNPFGQPKGTRMLLRFTPDAKLGYPRRYRRDVVGRPKGMAIDVIRLRPSKAALPPPPA